MARLGKNNSRTSPQLGQQKQNLDGLFGWKWGTSLEGRRNRRDNARTKLKKKGVFYYNLAKWDSDQYKARKDFDKIFKRAQNDTQAVEYINEFLDDYDKVTTSITRKMVDNFSEWQKKQADKNKQSNNQHSDRNSQTGGNSQSGGSNSGSQAGGKGNLPATQNSIQSGFNDKYLIYGAGALAFAGVGYLGYQIINKSTS